MAEQMAQQAETSSLQHDHLSKQYDCEKCSDKGYIIKRVPDINPNTGEQRRHPKTGEPLFTDVAVQCECFERKAIESRLKSAMIPEEFQNARFDNYERKKPFQHKMYDAMINYLREFNRIRNTRHNSIGFIATYGESKLKALPPGERNRVRQQHNNYGLGKTHLQMAAAKWLIYNAKIPDENGHMRGCRVLCISDTFIEDLSAAKRFNDDGEQFNKLLYTAIHWADVLVWDELGKLKHTETREGLYYRIINERYKMQKPIIFNSNEDADTLEDKIGFAAADRLFGMAKNHLYAVEGESYRTK
jgi:DNA replication protein DnaC